MKRIRFAMQGAWRLLGGLLLTFSLSQCSSDDGPNSSIPILSIDAATNITRTEADISGYIETNGTEIAECAFLYSMAESDLTSSNNNAQKKFVSTQSGKVTAHLEELNPNTTYYYCLYAKSGQSKVQSGIKSFDTEKQIAPILNRPELLEADEYSLKVRCSITSDGGATLQEYGFEYRKASETTAKSILAKGYDQGSASAFTVTIEGLDAGTKYIIRGVAKNSMGSSYSEEIECLTEELKTPVVTLYYNDLGADWVSVSAKIENRGASEIVERGFCWSTTTQRPTTSDNKKVINSNDDVFAGTITGLNPNTTYYLRAYATNNVNGKTLYGYSEEVLQFTTLQLAKAEVTSPEVSDITNNSFTATASLSSTGGTQITEVGFCWSMDKSQNPEDLVKHTASNPDSNNCFTLNVEGLEIGAVYYLYAYAVNSAGIAFSNVTEVALKKAPSEEDNVSPDK